MIMSEFEPAVEYVLQNEGGISRRLQDHGGNTNFGISTHLLNSMSAEKQDAYGIRPNMNVMDLTLENAKSIYRGEFWNLAMYDKIRHQDQCNYIFDMAVNMGKVNAVKCSQRAIWAVLHEWEKLKDNGVLDNKTLSLLNQRGFLLMPALRAERANYYRDLVRRH